MRGYKKLEESVSVEGVYYEGEEGERRERERSVKCVYIMLGFNA